jgi:hypothetical protein
MRYERQNAAMPTAPPMKRPEIAIKYADKEDATYTGVAVAVAAAKLGIGSGMKEGKADSSGMVVVVEMGNWDDMMVELGLKKRGGCV